MKKIYLFILLIIFFNIKTNSISDILISYKVNNEIITNIDIEKEAIYLIALNNDLTKLENKKIKEIAKDSILREKIKEIELIKYFKFNQQNPYLDKVIESFFLKLNLKSEEDFANYLKGYDLTIETIKSKIEIETLWNQLIYEIYNKQLSIDEEKLKNKVTIQKKLLIEKSFLLSEIVFEKDKNKSLDELKKKIYQDIEKLGFENAAAIYSISDTSKFGGKIGWMKKNELTNLIYGAISNLKINYYSKPIQLGNNFLILKVNDIKDEEINTDPEKELKKMILLEQERQLEMFSKIHFNKIKINTDVQKF
ncbi:peptidylprolyl isomerase [Candidatus Pelagibacter sp. Uisw_134_02]|uniref:peptidylprolyl isomerase n=1 Tax=Candidatus Pelagibacter sp. Uisw_134_02 TaxID=3230990 RepID=UPI0039EB9304